MLLCFMASSSAKRCRGWCFTINNPVAEDVAKIKTNLAECRYWVMGDEVGENGTPHIQGFLYCNNAVSFNTVRLWLLCKAHIEAIKGTAEDNITYCTKDGKFVEYGTRPTTQKEKGEKGKIDQKEKWSRIDELARAGDWEKLSEEFPKEAIVNLRNLRLRHQLAVDRKRDAKDVTGIWFFGESGAGKSHRARHYSDVFYIKGINKWWDNYEGEDTVILEDVSDKHEFLGDFLKLWSDKWAFTAEVKGASLRSIRPSTFIVTSQYTIDEIFKDEKTRTALKRRFKEIEVKRTEETAEAFPSYAQEVEMSLLEEPIIKPVHENDRYNPYSTVANEERERKRRRLMEERNDENDPFIG